MKKNLIILYSFICFLLPNCDLKAQVVAAGTNATATSSAKGSSSVDYVTGIMNYHIPLVNIDDGGFNISLGLSYAGKGIKVEQRPSVAGLGWSLTGTGVVCRTIRGLPDDCFQQWSVGILIAPPPTDPVLAQAYLKQVNKGERDGESDIFTASYGNLQVKFYLEKVVNTTYTYYAVALEKTDVRIEVVQDGYRVKGFILTDGKGDIYRFMEEETLGGQYTPGTIGNTHLVTNTTNAWYLNEVQKYTGQKVLFKYYTDGFSGYETSLQHQALIYGMPFLEYGVDTTKKKAINHRISQLSNPTNPSYYPAIVNELNTISSRMEIYGYQLNIAYQTYNQIQSSLSLENPTSPPSWNMQGVISGLEAQLQVDREQYQYLSSLLPIGTGSGAQYTQDPDLNDLLNSYWNVPSYKYADVSLDGIKSYSTSKLLKQIILPNKLIYLNYNISSRDGRLTAMLDTVQTRLLSGAQVSKAVLSYSPNVGQMYIPNSVQTNSYLKSVDFFGREAQAGAEHYTLEYYAEGDVINLYNQDYWGYHRGSLPYGNNTTLLPMDWAGWFQDFYYPDGINHDAKNLMDMFDSSYDMKYFQRGNNEIFGIPDKLGDRSLNAATMTDRSLKKVNLPGGGSLLFEYEPNSVLASDTTNLTYGGLRIKKLTENDGSGNNYVKEYKYEFANSYNNQLLSTGFNVKKSRQSFSVVVHYTDINPNTGIPYRDISLSSVPYDFSYQFEDTGNENVFYSYVEEVVQGLGRTGYRYLQFSDSLHTTYPYWLEHLLLSKSVYDEQGRLNLLERYKYTAANVDLVNYIGADMQSRFITSDQYGFAAQKLQYRAFPYRTPGIEVATYFPNENVGYNYNPYQMYYMQNLYPRREITDLPMAYSIVSGGKVLLKEIESWSSVQRNGLAGAIPPNTWGHYAGESGWLFAGNYGEGIWNKQTLSYDNPLHIYPSRQETLNSDGSRALIKNKYVRDYGNGASAAIDALKTSNVVSAKVEEQKWIYDPQDVQWRLSGATLTNYASVASHPDIAPAVSYTLPSGTFETTLTQPILSGTMGWNDPLSSTPPYTSLFHEGQQLFKPFTTIDWKAYASGVGPAGAKIHGGATKSATDYDLESGAVALKVSNTDANDVLALTYNYLQVLKPLTTSNYENFGHYDYDNLGYLREFQKQLKKWNNAYNHKLIRTLDTLITCIDNAKPYVDNIPLIISFTNLVLTYDVNLGNTINGEEHLYFSSGEVMNTCMNLVDVFYNTNFERQRAVVSVTGNYDFKLPLAGYRQSGKRIQFTNGSSPYKVIYGDGTPPLACNYPSSIMKNGIPVAYLSLNDIPNHANATHLLFESAANLSNSWFIIPEGSAFEYTIYNNFGLPEKVINEKGDEARYTYDQRNRLIVVRDKDGNIIKRTDYHYRGE